MSQTPTTSKSNKQCIWSKKFFSRFQATYWQYSSLTKGTHSHNHTHQPNVFCKLYSILYLKWTFAMALIAMQILCVLLIIWISDRSLSFFFKNILCIPFSEFVWSVCVYFACLTRFVEHTELGRLFSFERKNCLDNKYLVSPLFYFGCPGKTNANLLLWVTKSHAAHSQIRY